jgi:hypothetical protein
MVFFDVNAKSYHQASVLALGEGGGGGGEGGGGGGYRIESVLVYSPESSLRLTSHRSLCETLSLARVAMGLRG